MDILNIVQGYTPAIGGTELQIQRVSEELVRQFGDQVTVFTSDCYNAGGFVHPFAPRLPVGWDEINGVKVRRFRVFNQVAPILKPVQWLAYTCRFPFNEYLRVWYSGPILPGLADAIRQFRGDTVVAASFPLLHMFTAVRAARQARLPIILVGSQHPEDRWGFQRPMIDAAIKKANAYIAMTEYEARYVIERGAPAERVFVIGNGVDPAPFLAASPVEARNRLGLPPNVPVVGFVGQLGRYKGVDMLLKAMPRVWQTFPETCLLIAGAQTSFQPQIDSILKTFSPEQRERIYFRYNFKEPEKYDLFAALDVFTYPSGYESFGIAFLEAWAAGKPVIGCQSGAVPWVVQHQQDGLLVQYQDHQALAESILDLLNHPNWARQLGEAGHEKVINRFNWPDIAARFREVYAQAAHFYGDHA